jgi:hypothetical protein
MVDSIPDNLSEGRRAEVIAKMYGDFIGASVRSEGQGTEARTAANRDLTNERLGRANIEADTAQNAIKNAQARQEQDAAAQAAQAKAAYDNTRLGQYQAALNETAIKNAFDKQMAGQELTLKEQRLLLDQDAAVRARLKQASDFDIARLGVKDLDTYGANYDDQRARMSLTEQQMEAFRKQNPDRYK